jgi:hypothetical protein
MAVSTKTPAAPKDAGNVTNKPDVLAAIKRAAELKSIEAAGKAAEAERKLLEATIIRPALGSAKFAILRGVKAVTVQGSSNSHIDKDALRDAFPEAYAACYVSTPYTFLKYNV